MQTLMRSLVAKTCQLATSILQLPMTTAAAFMRRVAKRARVKQMVRVPSLITIPMTTVSATLMRSLVAKTCQLATSILQLPMTTAAAFMRRVAKRAQVKQMVRVPSLITIPMTTVSATLMRSLVAKTCQLATSMLQLQMTTVCDAFMRRVAKRAQVKQMVRVPSLITIPMTTVSATLMR